MRGECQVPRCRPACQASSAWGHSSASSVSWGRAPRVNRLREHTTGCAARGKRLEDPHHTKTRCASHNALLLCGRASHALGITPIACKTRAEERVRTEGSNRRGGVSSAHSPRPTLSLPLPHFCVHTGPGATARPRKKNERGVRTSTPTPTPHTRTRRRKNNRERGVPCLRECPVVKGLNY